MNRIMLIILSLIIFVSCEISTENKAPEEIKSLKQIVDSLNLDKNDLHLIIDKSDNKLYVMHREKILKDIEVVFGINYMEDKLMQGDIKTPEGNFKIRDLYPHPSWSKFIWIDYPNEESWRKHKKAKSEGIILADASIGGEIGIHGVPEGKDYYIDDKTNWTLGCISMRNKNIDELYPLCYIGMRVVIQK